MAFKGHLWWLISIGHLWGLDKWDNMPIWIDNKNIRKSSEIFWKEKNWKLKIKNGKIVENTKKKNYKSGF